MNASKFANLSTEEKRRALQVLLEQRRDAAPVAPLPPQRPVIVPRPAERHLPFPLTPVQESFLVAKQLTRGADAVGCHIYLELEEPALDVARLERAWQRLVDHHEMLRASVSADGRQQIAPRLPAARFAVDDLRAASATDLDAHLRRVRAALAHKVYPPDASPLWTIQVTHAADTSIIHLSIDEWIVDAASLNRVVTQWCQLYREPATALPPCELSFRDHVLATRAFEDTAAYQQDLGYWCDKLAGMPGDPALPRPASPSSPVRRRIDGSLDRAAWAALRRKADDLSVSPTALLLTLFAEALAAHSDPGPFSLTLTYFNRPPLHPQIEELIAPLISTHRFLADGAAASVQDRVVRAQRQLWRDVDHDRADAISALRALRGRHQAPPGASRIVFTSVLGNVGKEAGRDGQTWLDRVRHAVTQTPGINLDHQIAEQDGALRFTWDVVDSAFRPGLIDALFATYLDILRAFATTDALWTAPCWRDQRRGTALAIAARPDERHLPFPLTDLQRAYFVGRTGLMANGGVSCQLYQELTLDDDNGDRIAGRVERAWQRLIDAHDMLRAIIQSDGNQRIVPAGQPVDLRVADLTAVSADERARHLAAVRDQMVTQVFPLDRWPFFELRLSRTEPTRAILHLSIDFLIADAVSIHTLLQRFFALYQDVGAPCEAPSLSFRDYQLALKAHEGSPDHGRSVAYWKQRLTDLPDGPDLGMRSLASKERPHRRRLHGALRAWRALQATAARHGVSDEAVLLGVYLDVLATAARRAPFTVVVARWDRPPVHPQIYDIVGDFTAISWIASAQGGTFAERLQQIQRGLDDDRAHPLVSGSRILQQLAVRSRDRRFQTFPVVFTGLSPGPRDVPASITIGEQITQTPQVYLDNISIEACDALQLHWDAVDGIFPDGLIESLFATYCATLERLAVDAEAWHSFDAVATPAKPAPRHHTTLHRLIEDRVARCPDHPAVVFEGAQLTFAELNHRANQVARYLQRQGVAPDRLVGVLFDRSIEMCVALLAILKAGGAYVPIDPTYPQDRIDFLLEDAGVSALLTQERLRLHSYRGPQLCLDSECVDAEAGDDLGETTAPDRIAYVIYTSGSTGKPKGCMIPHDAICNRLLWMQDEYRLRPDDRVLQKTPYTFDVSVWEFFLPWIAGATLVVARPDGHRDTGYLVRLMDEQRITICHFVPSMLNFFLKEPVLPRFLRQVFASGEALPYDLVDTFLRRLDARLHNLYGPTEAAVDVSYWACERRPDRTVPIGRAIANVELLVLDAQRRPVPAGEQGELHIGGVCLARGYLNRPELTRDRFISLEDGTRVYRTGDLARVLDDGNLEYLGRIDSQVKLRGFRIELGEIEAALAGHPAVRGAVVAVQDAGTDDPKLIAYVVTGDHTAPSRALKAYLKQRLPEYMVPNRFVAIPAIPVTAHGKCDRKALPWPVAPSPEPTEIAPEVPAAPAATAPPEVLPALRALFAEALQVATLGDDDDLFDLGATSLTIVRTSQRIEAELQVELPVEVVLAEPTVAAIARYVQSRVVVAAPAAVAMTAAAAVPAAAAASINFLSREDRDQFKARQLQLRHDVDDRPTIALADAPVAPQVYLDRASRTDYASTPLSLDAFSRLFALLRRYPADERARSCFPSAGGTYAVQTYVHVIDGAIDGIAGGLYYFHPERNQLVQLTAAPSIRRANHFYYNREHFDRAGFGLYFVAQTDASRPIYGELAESFAAIETGCIVQLLMSHQAELGVGLCPMAGFDLEAVRTDFQLGAGHRFVLAMLGGAVPARAAPPAGPAPTTTPTTTPTDRSMAIIGVAGRYPGAETPSALWPLLRDGERVVAPSTTRWPAAAARPVGLVSSIDRFDSHFFQITPAEARLMDPQERQFLEVAWACLESAGYVPEALRRAGLRVGVFVGAMWNDYQNVAVEAWVAEARARTGSFHSGLANRVSHLFDLRGPSLSIDTSCSSGLTALHLASRSLRDGDCDLALVGGVNLISHPFHLELLAGLGLTSQDDRTRSFGADGTGWVPGEGVGAVLLRPLAIAEASRDAIRAVVRGTSVGHGRAARYGMPSTEAQARSIQAALADAGVTGSEIDYVECAATGSGLADASEVNAVKQALARPADAPPCVLGSIKPNLGHLESASGLSQLTKVLLQLEHRELAPTIDAEPVNPLIQLGPSFRLARTRAPWTTTGRRRALINGFGATGSAAHVIVEDHVTPAAPTAATSTTAAQVFALSADTPSQLEAMAADLRDHLRDRTLDARDVAFTLQVGRPARAERLAIVAASTSELVADLDRFLLDGSGHRGRATAASAAAPDASASAEDLARAWVAGAAIAWHERDVDSSARRVALPTYRFASASHWLRAGGQSVATGPAPIAAATDVPAPAAPASPSPVAAPALRGALLDVLASTVADVAELPRDAIDPEVTLDRYGLTSALAIEIVRRLEALTGRLPRTLLFEHPTLNAIADVLIARHRGALEASLGIDRGAPGVPTASTPTAASTPTSAPTASTPTAAPTSRAPITAPGAAAIADIAIVGIAGRFPGADTIDAFWQNLREGRDAITAPPPDRADGAWFEGKPRWGGFLSDIAAFDPRLFQISPREAATMDPQERLFLETAWCALEDAGYSRGHLAEVQGTAGGGVFVGSMYQQYALLAGPDADVSSSFWSIANRVSHVFDLRGPSLAVDTACSSSLTAIHMACESLRRGECAVALAGGVNLHLHASKYDALERLGLLGSDARSRSLGDGDGYVPAEAVGAVVLRPLSDAVARGDRVYAVIKGSFLNHAGRTASFGVPSPTAEAALIATALARAGIDPGTIDYVEVAANGSPLGDAIEISGLRRAFADAPRSHGPCAIGSVKSSIGHPEAASGIAQLAKVVCQLQHRALVPTLHAEPLNPDIDLGDQLHVQRTLAAWPASTHPRRAAITSRGAGGASTHVIVEEFAAADPADQPVVAPGPCIVPLSASSLEQLRALAAALADDLGRRQRRRGLGQIALTERDLPAIAWTLQRGREAMIERAAIVSASLPGLIDQLRAVAAGEPAPGVTTGTATAVAARFLDGREGDAYLSILIADGKHDRLAALWASGASLPWRRLYGDRTPAIVSLPHYPFARQRCWLEAQPLATAAPARSAQAPAAPAATPAFAASPAAAPDELVDHLAVLVADALKLSPDELDRDADLRTYGLDSRLAARFMQTVQRRFGHGVALTAAYAHPTLNRLAAHLAPIAAHTTTAPTAAAAPSPSDQPRRIAIPADDARELVAINPSGTQPASFWVHGAAGTAQPFHALSAALGSDYPVFAFQARGLDGAAMPFTRVEDAAAHYVACLQRQQAAGPYLLGGLSSGGILAFEMARQLRDRGERVSRLVLLDTYPAVASTMQESGDYVDPSFQNLMMANAFLRFGEAAIRPEDVAGLSPAQQVPRLVELIKARSHTALGVDELYRLLSDTIAVYQALDAGLRQYEPTPIDGVDALFFHAEKGFFGDADVLGIPALDVFRDYDSIGPWRRWIHGALDVVPLACGHVEILEAPAIDQVVARLRTVLSPTPRARPARPQPVVRSNP